MRLDTSPAAREALATVYERLLEIARRPTDDDAGATGRVTLEARPREEAAGLAGSAPAVTIVPHMFQSSPGRLTGCDAPGTNEEARLSRN